MADAISTSRTIAEAAHRSPQRPLDAIFIPRNIAVIGATEAPGSVGRTLLWNLISSPFGGTVFPINPKVSSVLGIKAYPSISDVPEKVDLAVVVTPAPTVPSIMGQCADAGVRVPSSSPPASASWVPPDWNWSNWF